MIFDSIDGTLVQTEHVQKDHAQLIVLSIDALNDSLPAQLDYETVRDTMQHTMSVSQPDLLYGAIHRPAGHAQIMNVFFAITKSQLILIAADANQSDQIAQQLIRASGKHSPHQRLCHLLASSFKGDAQMLEALEDEIDHLEDVTLGSAQGSFEHKMAVVRRRIRSLHMLYSRAQDVIDQIIENEYDVLDEQALPAFKRLADTIDRLLSTAQMLREYALQVLDMRQSQIAIQQNRIMQLLTVVTTLFLPLSLITGWYGMNFANMPELQSPYGYLGVTLLCALIVVVCIIFFKRKRFF